METEGCCVSLRWKRPKRSTDANSATGNSPRSHRWLPTWLTIMPKKKVNWAVENAASCALITKSWSSIKRNIGAHRNSPVPNAMKHSKGNNSLTCTCKEVFQIPTEALLRCHSIDLVQGHEKNRCSECGEEFSDFKLLARHTAKIHQQILQRNQSKKL